MDGLVEVTYIGGGTVRVSGESASVEFQPAAGQVVMRAGAQEEVVEWDLIRTLRSEGAVQLLH